MVIINIFKKGGKYIFLTQRIEKKEDFFHYERITQAMKKNLFLRVSKPANAFPF